MDDLLPLAQEIQIFCAIVTKAARRDLEQRLAGEQVGIGSLPFGVLRVLEHESLTLTEISRRMQLAAASLVPAVDALEREGLLTRERDPHDRRRTPLSLTAAGHATLARIPALAPEDSLVRSLA
nr:MarR family transcriptional regulator [Chloroflexaceae bacterium]